jgi:hypothetical protein
MFSQQGVSGIGMTNANLSVFFKTNLRAIERSIWVSSPAPAKIWIIVSNLAVDLLDRFWLIFFGLLVKHECELRHSKSKAHLGYPLIIGGLNLHHQLFPVT